MTGLFIKPKYLFTVLKSNKKRDRQILFYKQQKDVHWFTIFGYMSIYLIRRLAMPVSVSMQLCKQILPKIEEPVE